MNVIVHAAVYCAARGQGEPGQSDAAQDEKKDAQTRGIVHVAAEHRSSQGGKANEDGAKDGLRCGSQPRRSQPVCVRYPTHEEEPEGYAVKRLDGQSPRSRGHKGKEAPSGDEKEEGEAKRPFQARFSDQASGPKHRGYFACRP